MNQQPSLQRSVPTHGMQKSLRRLATLLFALMLSAAANAQPYAYAVKSTDGLFKINLADGRKDFIGLTALPGQPPVSIEALALSPDGVLYGVGGYSFYKIDTHTGALTEIKHLMTRPGGTGLDTFQAMAFKGTILLGLEGRLHGDLVTIDPATGNTSHPIALVSPPTYSSDMEGVAMAMFDDTHAFITADGGRSLELLDVESGQSVFRGNPSVCFALAFAGDGKLYALGLDQRLYSVNTSNGNETFIADASTSSAHPWSDMVAIPLPPVIYHPGVVNAASRMSPVAPGSLATIFGYGFAPGANSATRTPTQGGSAALPTTLGGISVKVNGIPAPIYYADFQQINFQVPYETLSPYPLLKTNSSPALSAQVLVTNPFGTTISTFPMAYAAPGIFVSPQGPNLAVAADYKGNPVNAANPLHSGDRATLYLTGQGFLNNPIADGHSAPVLPVSTPLDHFSVTVGGLPATVLSAEMTPNEIGVFQIEIVVPQLPTGDYSVVVTAPTCTPYAGCENHESNSPSLPIK